MSRGGPWQPMRRVLVLAAALLAGGLSAAAAQPMDLSQGGPIQITARDGIAWHQHSQTVVASGDARATRGQTTVLADRLIAFYRRKTTPGATAHAAPQPSQPQPPGALPADVDTGDNEIYRLEALGHVRIITPTDQARGDKAVYDIDQSVLVLSGHDLRLTTPQYTITAKDSLEYWAQRHMAVARGEAVATTNDARQVRADTLVAYMSAPTAEPARSQPATAMPAAKQAGPPANALAESGKLERIEAFGHVVIRTATQLAQGTRGIYVPDSGLARLAGPARLTQGQNQVTGAALEVNLNTGVYRLLSAPHQRVEGVVLPSDAQAPTAPGAAGGAKPAASKAGTGEKK